ncbi:hypothetical protein TASIC1_0002032500 [Trichoderma asperellum]|uniref:Uncharacterized protein n=1 Tax=Trichoderma asperellum TaxID=101201 RepID=A0A6V8QKX7_TRIAP|nr:hypothetical protein LI328DRAFT_172231 [Trichoderma asperelloides]GFP53141.1 hypothetical protein TASIC1_0002032500 [Trichoderma asperellum]
MPFQRNIANHVADPVTHICSLIAFYHLHLAFIISYIFYAAKAVVLIADHGYYSSYHDFSIIEVWAFIKHLVGTWLLLFHIAFFAEVAAFMIWAYPFVLGWRREDPDEIEYLPLVVRLNMATNGWMGRRLGWHMDDYYWAEFAEPYYY